MSKKPYEVELIVTTRHLFTIPAAYSPESAIADAESLLEDGTFGDIVSREVETADAYPVEDILEYEDDNIEEEGV